MPAKTEKQRKFMAAELRRKREGKKTQYAEPIGQRTSPNSNSRGANQLHGRLVGLNRTTARF